MLFILIFVLFISAVLGWVSSYYNKLFMSMIFGLPVAAGGALKFIGPMLSTADLTPSEIFATLPQEVQFMIMFAPLTIIGGRIAGWIYQVYFQKEKVIDKDKRRKQVLAEHGMEDPLAGPAPKVDWMPSLAGHQASKPAAAAPRQPRQARSVNRSKRSTSFGTRT